MGGREAVCFHLLHGFLRCPSLFGQCNHHSGAVIAGLAMDKNLLAGVVAKQSKELGDLFVFRVVAIPGNGDVMHPKLDLVDARLPRRGHASPLRS